MATWNTRGLRGSTLEDMVNRTNEKYAEAGLALIQKIPTPITPVKMDKESRQITLAFFEQKSTVDYIGVVQGIPVCFDAKECAVDTFSLQNIHPHQVEFMHQFEKQGGIAFFLIFYSHKDLLYYLPYEMLRFFWDRAQEGGRKSFRFEELNPEYIIPKHQGILVPYLDILKKHDIPATFFLIGQQVEEMPEVVERELKEGHEVGVHTYTHESCDIYQSCEAYYEDVHKVKDLLEEKFRYQPKLWRFPWGSANCYIRSYKEEIVERLHEEKMEFADWNVSAEDSVGHPGVESILANVKKDAFRVQDPVVLMHDSGSNRATLDSLEAVITMFEEKGYRFQTLSQRKTCCHFGE